MVEQFQGHRLIQSKATGKRHSLAITIADVTKRVVAHHEYPG
jgi:hypothetical protein